MRSEVKKSPAILKIALLGVLGHNGKRIIFFEMRKLGEWYMSGGNKDKDLFDAVGDIADIVNRSIARGDYSSLNREITKVLNSAADAVHDGLTGAARDTVAPFFEVEGARSYRADTKSSYEDARQRTRKEHNEAGTNSDDGVVSSVGSYVRMILGAVFTFNFGIVTLGGIIAGEALPLFLVFGVLTAVSGWNLFKGIRKLKLIRQAKKLLKLMENRDTITVEEVASAFGMDPKAAADELQAMMREGVFTGKAYMDKEETAFMTSHQAYNQYLATMKAYEERTKSQESVFKKEDLKEYARMERGIAERERNETKEAAKLNRETMEIVEEGKAFIRHIHQKNEEVPDPVFTEKLNRLERIVTNIFDRVAASPQTAPDLHRLMKYYLPTTQKLVDTYATLDGQSVQGKNIETAKKEIVESLDTINSAFEKFLDSFFQTTAWDVSSDISVMNTLMSQDGLTGGNDFSSAASASQMQSTGAAQAYAPAQGAAQSYSAAQSTGAAQAYAPAQGAAQAYSAAQSTGAAQAYAPAQGAAQAYSAAQSTGAAQAYAPAQGEAQAYSSVQGAGAAQAAVRKEKE